MRTIVDAIRRNERLYGDRAAVIDEQRRLTHRELATNAWAIAHTLRSLGVEPHDTVGMLGGNSVFTAEAFLGTVAAGAAFVPYNSRWTTPELVAGINDTNATVILIGEGMAGAIEAAIATGEIVRTVIPLQQGPDLITPAGGHPPVPVDVHPEDACCILFTGGTTGTSKGVVISHRAALSNCVNEISDCRVGAAPDDIGLIAAPMFHSAALLCWFLPHYVTGTASYLLNKFDEHRVGEVVTRERITDMFLVPNMIHRLEQSGAFQSAGFQTTFRALHTGAGALHMPDRVALASTLPRVDVYVRYGLTEAGPMVSRLLPPDLLDPSLDGSIGKEYLLAEVQLRDPGTGLPAAPGEIGEIYVRGPSLMSGYYGHPEATAEVLRNGWLQTGDLGVRDARGYLFFRDRVKDMIKTGGESVYSVEIEQAVSTHPAVLDVVVLGVPSREWNEEVRAVVAVRPGSTLTETELREYLRQTLAAYKVPKVIALVPPGAIPVNASGKFVKKIVREAMGW